MRRLISWTERGGQAAAAVSQGMAQGDRPAVYVDPFHVQAQRAAAVEGLEAKASFVEEVDLVQLQAGKLEGLGHGLDGPDPHEFRGNPGYGKGTKGRHGARPRDLAFSLDRITVADAPSFRGDEFPGVTEPVVEKAGLSLLNASGLCRPVCLRPYRDELAEGHLPVLGDLLGLYLRTEVPDTLEYVRSCFY